MTATDAQGRSISFDSPDGSMPTEDQLNQMFAMKYSQTTEGNPDRIALKSEQPNVLSGKDNYSYVDAIKDTGSTVANSLANVGDAALMPVLHPIKTAQGIISGVAGLASAAMHPVKTAQKIGEELTSTNNPDNVPEWAYKMHTDPFMTAGTIVAAGEGGGAVVGGLKAGAKLAVEKAVDTGRYFKRVKSTFNPQSVENLNVPSTARLNNLADKSQEIANTENSTLKAFNENIETQKSKTLQDISYKVEDYKKSTELAIRDSRRVLKQNATQIKGELDSAAEKGALEFQEKLPDFFKANGEAYESARDAGISQMQANGKGITYQEVSDAIASAKQQAIDDLIPQDAPGFKMLNELEGRYAPQAKGPAGTITDRFGKPIPQEIANNANDFVDPNQLIQDLRNVKSSLSASAKSGASGFSQEDLVVAHLNNGVGSILKERVPGFAQLQADYTPVIRAMKEAHKIFQPNKGNFNTKNAASLLRQAGTKGEAFNETGGGRVLNALEEGNKFSPGVGKISAPVREAGSRLKETVSSSQKEIEALQNNLTAQLKKLNDMKRSTVGQSDAAVTKNQQAIARRELALKDRLEVLDKRKQEVVRLNANKGIIKRLQGAILNKTVDAIPGGSLIKHVT